MFKKKKKQISGKVDTIVGKDTLLEGTIKGTGTIRLDGKFEGNIDIEGNLIIGESADVKGEIKAQNMFLAGRLSGTVEIYNKLELCSSGRLYGDVKTNNLIIQEGGLVEGDFLMPLTESSEINDKENVETRSEVMKED